MSLTKNFYLQEFVTPYLYKKWKDRSVIFVDERMIYLAQWIRDRFGKPMTINNWHSGGKFKYRGWRPPYCKVGSRYSQHKAGRGLDVSIVGISIKEIHEDIKDNQRLYYNYGLRVVESMEKAPTWMHLDCRTTFTDYQILWF